MIVEKWPHEIFNEVQKLEDREDRISYLKENSYRQVKTILQLAYNDNIQLALPKGKPPFIEWKENITPPDELSMNSIFKDISQCVVQNKTKTELDKEIIFIKILESIPYDDALLLCAAKDGTLVRVKNKSFSKITKSLVEATFPEIL